MSDEPKTCRRGHVLGAHNTTTTERNGHTILRCLECRRITEQNRKERIAEGDFDGEATTPVMAINSLRQSKWDGRRSVIVIGLHRPATAWIRSNVKLPADVRVCTRPEDLYGVNAKAVHLVLLPSYADLPEFWTLQVDVRLLERLGATVEVA